MAVGSEGMRVFDEHDRGWEAIIKQAHTSFQDFGFVVDTMCVFGLGSAAVWSALLDHKGSIRRQTGDGTSQRRLRWALLPLLESSV